MFFLFSGVGGTEREERTGVEVSVATMCVHGSRRNVVVPHLVHLDGSYEPVCPLLKHERTTGYVLPSDAFRGYLANRYPHSRHQSMGTRLTRERCGSKTVTRDLM